MTPASPPEDGRPSSVAASHVNQNVETIAALYARAEDSLSHHQKIVERLTTWVGRPAAFYSILLLGSIWIAANVVMLGLGAAPPDPPPFFWLQGFVTFSALLVATMVLTTQNRQAKQAERRAQLDLQVSTRPVGEALHIDVPAQDGLRVGYNPEGDQSWAWNEDLMNDTASVSDVGLASATPRSGRRSPQSSARER